MSDEESYYSNNSDSDQEGGGEEEEELNVKKSGSVAKKIIIKDENYDDDSQPEDNDPEDELDDDDIEDDDQEKDEKEDDIKIEDEDGDGDDSEYDEENNDSDIEINEDGDVKEKNIKQLKPKKTTQLIIDDEDEDEDEYEENYLQKFDNELNKNYITEFHPECLFHNNDEITKLSKVIRDENNIIIDPLHKTLPYLTKYEKARVLGQRAKQIETGAKPLVKTPENIIDSYVIAELELREKKIPFIIKRPIPGGAFEYWNLRDLENINF
jgi:DNA-directed RNA polymerase I, II, and III subunit RPABC2